jgi:MFS family permease
MPAAHLYPRVAALVALVFVSLAAGTSYLYGVYGPQLVKQCRLTTLDSATISLFINIGCGIGGLPGGVLIDAVGPQLAILMGLALIAAGYYGVYRVYQLAALSLALLSVFMCVMGFGSITSYFATLKAAQLNFPHHRGLAGALPVSAYGLSATLLLAVAAIFYKGDSGGFIGFLALACGSVTFVGLWFVHVYLEDDAAAPPPPHSATDMTADPEAGPPSDEDVPLLLRESSSLTLASAAASGPPQATPMARDDSLKGSLSFWGIGTRTPRSSVGAGAAPRAAIDAVRQAATATSGAAAGAARAPALSHQSSSLLFRTKAAPPAAAPPLRLPAHHVVAALLANPNFLRHYLIVSLLSGVGQMYIYSVGFVVIAQYHRDTAGGDDADGVAAGLQALQVSTILIASFSGRLVLGVLSDLIHKRYHVQRLWIVLATVVFLAAGQLVIIYAQHAALITVASAVIGGSYGLIFGTYPAVMADEFGTRTFLTTWGLVCTGPLITLFVLNKYFGWIYDRNTDALLGLCHRGNACYRGAFELSLALCAVAMAAVVWVMVRARRQYIH